VSTPDPYKVLQVDPEAEDEVIEAAYRRLARKYHPDVAPAPDSQERMVRINQAWEQLRDPMRRAAVDRARARAATQAARVSAADAQARTAGGTAPGYDRATHGPGVPFRRRQGATPSGVSRPSDPGWPLPGMRDPSDGTTIGGAPDPATSRFAPGEAAAGPPPGNPSGSVLNFGRYTGWSLGEIARVELEYLEWLDRMPIGRFYQPEIDAILRKAGRRVSTPTATGKKRGLFRRG
jgi:curved DNA-binding protein CbpA